MEPFTTRTFAALAASVAALCALASAGAAEPSSYGDPYKTAVVAAPSPYWGYSYYPYGGTLLHGVASIIEAKGDYLIKTQQAALLREQVRREKLVTRRLQLEHWEWERDFKAGALNRERKRVYEAELERARYDPPRSEILAAVSLNNLLKELKKLQQLPEAKNGSATVEGEWLDHIHTTVEGRSNMGLLKDDRIFWPQLLIRSDLSDGREKIEQLLTRAKQQVLQPQRKGQVDPQLLSELRQRVTACKKSIDAEWSSGGYDVTWNTRHYTEANRFLKQVGDAIYTLEQPEAAMLLVPLRGATVFELVANMKRDGIFFAPATQGCDQFYIALHAVLADELTRLQQK